MKKVTQIIQQAKQSDHTQISLEILPPARGNGLETVFQQLEQLIDLDPKFINVTYHRREQTIITTIDGKQHIKQTSRRPGTIGISSAIQQRFGVSTVVHLICGGFTKEETEDALIELSYLGINNVLALRGDGLLKDDKKFIPTKGGHDYALGLVQQIKNMNEGKYLEQTEEGANNDFCIGVAAYPEKHFEAASMQEDIHYLKQKLEAGAEYAVTQMFFDNQYYFDFLKQCQTQGVNIPIVPGLKPITKKKHSEMLPKIFHTQFPEALSKALNACKNDQDAAQVGTEWLAYQVQGLKAQNVPLIHFYTIGAAALPIRTAIEKGL